MRRKATIKLFDFFQHLRKDQKWVFWSLLTIIVLLVLMIFGAFLDPLYFVKEIIEIQNSSSEPVLFEKIKTPFMDLKVLFEGYSQKSYLSLGTFKPVSSLIVVFIVLQAISWGLFTAAVTKIRSNWVYLFYFMIASFVYTSDLGQFLPLIQGKILNITISLLVLILCYLLQQNVLKMVLYARMVLFTLIFGIGYLSVYYFHGLEGIFGLSCSSFPIMIVFVALFLVFISKDYIGGMVYMTSNYWTIKEARGYPKLLPAVFILLLFLALILLDQLGYWRTGVIASGFRPIYLFLFATLISPLLSFNIYTHNKGNIEGVISFIVLIFSFFIIVLSFVFFEVSQAGYLFLNLLERHTIVFGFFTSVFYLAYILLNFHSRIKEKEPVYFSLYRGESVGFFFVFFVPLIFVIAIEARDLLKSFHLISSIQNTKVADQNLLRGDIPEARKFFRYATYYAPGAVKANHNLGNMLLYKKESLDSVFIHLRQSQQAFEYENSMLNIGNVRMGINESENAVFSYKKGLKKNPTPELYNNIGLIFDEMGRPDSAVYYMEKGIEIDPDHSVLHSNLASIYLENEQKIAALAHLEQALQSPTVSEAALTNAIMYQLKTGERIELKTELFDQDPTSFDEGSLINRLTYLIQEEKFEVADSLLDHLTDQQETVFVQFLWGVLDYKKGNIDNANSRFAYILQTYPEFHFWINHFLGCEFLRKGSVEMAMKEFEKIPFSEPQWHNIVYLAHIHGLTGNRKMSKALFRKGLENIPSVSKIAKLHLLLLDGDSLVTPHNLFLSSAYINSPQEAESSLGKFKDALENNPESEELAGAYLKLLLIVNTNADLPLVENLLGRFPKNVVINQLSTNYFLSRKEIPKAEKTISIIKQSQSSDYDYYKANLDLIKGDTSKAVEGLKKQINENPFDTKSYLLLGGVYKAQDLVFDGYELFYNATRKNELNSELWYYLAGFAQRQGELFYEDCGFAALKAINFANTEERKLSIEKEFSDYIKLLDY